MTLKNKWIIRYFTIMKGTLAVIFLCCIIYGEACCKKPDDPMDDDDPEEQMESQEPGLIPLMQIQEEGNEIQEQERMPAEEENEVQEADYATLMEALEESESLEPDLMQSMDGMQPMRSKISKFVVIADEGSHGNRFFGVRGGSETVRFQLQCHQKPTFVKVTGIEMESWLGENGNSFP